jgi:hypothetical protein
MPFASGPILTYIGAGQYKTVGPTVYVGSERHGRDVLTIPSDFPTDLATVPRIFWAFLPPNGTYERAAVAHDWHCVQLAAGNCRISSRDADGLFRRMAREGGAGFLTRWVLWTGVRWGAVANHARRGGWLRDAPLVLLITVAGLAAIGSVIYGLDRLAHAIGGAL